MCVCVQDVYVKASLLVAGKRLKKKKTSSSTARLTAVWNEALTFTALPRQLVEASVRLELTLHHGNHGDAVGKVTVGRDNDVGAEELHHWTDMLDGRPAVARWHELRPVTSDTRHHHRQHQQQQHKQHDDSH